MAALIKAFYYNLRYVYDLRDPRSDDWFLMSSMLYPIGIAGFYLYFVLRLGPRLMKHRPPFKLDTIIKVYNILQVIFSLYMAERCFTLGWGRKYQWFCEPVDFSRTSEAYQIMAGVYTYMLLKILDFLDTIFFVLRKKQSQVSFLHVYHHAGVFLGSWVIMRYLPGGHGTFVGYLNSTVHVIMYSYYFITMTWPEYRKKLWWKKYITQLQMVQFLLITLHALSVFILPDCRYPKLVAAFMLIQYSFMFILFLDFYVKAYIKKSRDL